MAQPPVDGTATDILEPAEADGTEMANLFGDGGITKNGNRSRLEIRCAHTLTLEKLWRKVVCR